MADERETPRMPEATVRNWREEEGRAVAKKQFIVSIKAMVRDTERRTEGSSHGSHGRCRRDTDAEQIGLDHRE